MTPCHQRQDLVLGYWREVLERPVNEVVSLATPALTKLRATGLPYHVVAGADLEPGYQQWLIEMLPQVT